MQKIKSIVRFRHPRLAWPCFGQLLDGEQVQGLDTAPWLGASTLDELYPLSEVELLAPCTPGKIVCVGKNYREHAQEMTQLRGDGGVPSEPLLFLKPPSALNQPGGSVEYPSQSERVDYEGELALVIGRRARQLQPEQSADYIYGYTVANDVTARDLQSKDGQWTRAKGFDGFCPLGPLIVTQIAPDASLVTVLNGKVVQSSTIDRMVFSPEFLVAYISQVMTLEPGDVILTGTPAGIGPMQPGDEVSVEISGIGILRNSVVKKPEE